MPEQAEVENISVEECEEDIMTLDEFSRVFSALQLSKIAQAGLGMIEMQKRTLGKQDETITIIKSGNEMLAGKQDQMLGKQDQMLDKQDQMLGKQDETIAIIKSGVDETRAFRAENKTILQDFHLDTMQRFDSLDVKYGRIAENIERILE